MLDLDALLPGLPYGRDCDAIPDIAQGLENTAEALVDLSNSTTVSPLSRYPSLVDPRLTLESGVPVSDTDQSGVNTLYYTPYDGDLVPLYDTGEADFIDRYLTSEISLSLLGLPANLNVDIFAHYSSGIQLTTELWASDTVRNVALTTVRGIKVKSGALTHRHIGTIRTNALGGQCEDTRLQRFLWNRYKRRERPVGFKLAGANYNYNNATWRYLAGNPANRVEFVNGDDDGHLELLWQGATFGTATNVGAYAMGYDSSTAPDADCNQYGSMNVSALMRAITSLEKTTLAGFHFAAPIERCLDASGSVTFYANPNSVHQNGCSGHVIA